MTAPSRQRARRLQCPSAATTFHEAADRCRTQNILHWSSRDLLPSYTMAAPFALPSETVAAANKRPQRRNSPSAPHNRQRRCLLFHGEYEKPQISQADVCKHDDMSMQNESIIPAATAPSNARRATTLPPRIAYKDSVPSFQASTSRL